MRCDEGYRCEVCGVDVEAITESDLYLRYVLGEVPLECLHRMAERHIGCNPALAQYIVDSAFIPIYHEGPFDKRTLDASYRLAEEQRVTMAWQRLQALPTLGLPITEYPLSQPEVSS